MWINHQVPDFIILCTKRPFMPFEKIYYFVVIVKHQWLFILKIKHLNSSYWKLVLWGFKSLRNLGFAPTNDVEPFRHAVRWGSSVVVIDYESHTLWNAQPLKFYLFQLSLSSLFPVSILQLLRPGTLNLYSYFQTTVFIAVHSCESVIKYRKYLRSEK